MSGDDLSVMSGAFGVQICCIAPQILSGPVAAESLDIRRFSGDHFFIAAFSVVIAVHGLVGQPGDPAPREHLRCT